MNLIYAHPVAAALLVACAALAVGVVALEYERIRDTDPARVPQYMKDWFAK